MTFLFNQGIPTRMCEAESKHGSLTGISLLRQDISNAGDSPLSGKDNDFRLEC